MDRLTKERGSIGRGKVWRRRRKRKAATTGTPQPLDVDDAPAVEVALERASRASTKSAEAGVWSMVRGLFGKGGKKGPGKDSEQSTVAPGDDPVRRILALPKGPARLDAFAETLNELTPGSHAQRAVALAFHKELVTMADKAGVDLSLLPERVEACAEALVAAGEAERAGQMLAKIGRRQRAAELFVAAGAIDDLEEMHLHIDIEEGGAKRQAKLSYERFEALFLVGRRAEALDALIEAGKGWPDNPVYKEILKTFQARILRGQRARFTSGSSVLDVVGKWPVVIGRGEDAAVRLKSPLVSRAHVQIEQRDDRLMAFDLDDRKAAAIDGEPILAGRALAERGTITLLGVAVRYQVTSTTLLLSPELQSEHKTLCARGGDVVVPTPAGQPGFTMRFDAQGRAEALPSPGASIGDEPLTKPTLILAGDKIGGARFLWHAVSN